MMIAADEVLLTQQELDEKELDEAEQAQNAPPDPEMVKLQLQQQLAEMEGQSKLQLAEMERETEMLRLSMQHELTREQVMARLQQVREQSASKERMFAAEAAIETRRDEAGVTRGSGRKSVRFKDPAHFARLLAGDFGPQKAPPPSPTYCMFCCDADENDLAVYGGCAVCGNSGAFSP